MKIEAELKKHTDEKDMEQKKLQRAQEVRIGEEERKHKEFYYDFYEF
jgi:hypothetical protein